MAYKGSLWGLPVATKSLALFYRTDLAPQPPATTDDLFAMAPAMKKRGGYALAYANADLYGHAPWLFGCGGRILDDNGELAIASEEAADAMKLAKRFVDEGVAPNRTENPQVAAKFNDGSAATAISGPWFIAGIAKDVPWKVAPLPIVSSTGKPAAPFFGAEGILMSSRAKDKDVAFEAMDFLTSNASATERAKQAEQVVPNLVVYRDPEVAKDEVLMALRAQVANAVPMPKGPAMRMVWTPYKTALDSVLSGRTEPGAALLGVEREVQSYLDGAHR
jgi:maltose-binding protein MalE